MCMLDYSTHGRISLCAAGFPSPRRCRATPSHYHREGKNAGNIRPFSAAVEKGLGDEAEFHGAELARIGRAAMIASA